MRKESFFIAFVAIFLSIGILILSSSGNFKTPTLFLEKLTVPIQSATFSFFQNLPFFSQDPRIKRLEEENLELKALLLRMKRLEKENAALLDQFQTLSPKSNTLLIANIVARPTFVPGLITPEELILDKGKKDKVKAGQAVIYKNNLVGKIIETSEHLSKVLVLTNTSFSFTVKTEKGAIGAARGKGGKEIALDSILVSENIKIGQTVVTGGEGDLNSIEIPSGLIVGKIVALDKKPTALFQKAKVESNVDFGKLSTVFIFTGTN